MNWIQVVYIQLKQIWSLFSPPKAKKKEPVFYFPSAKAWKYESKSQLKKAMKLGPNDNWGTGRYLWIEFKLFISNWKRFDLYFP